MTMSMAVRCAKHISVARSGSSYATTEVCPAGHPAGTNKDVLLDLCLNCEFAAKSPAQMAVEPNPEATRIDLPPPPQMAIVETQQAMEPVAGDVVLPDISHLLGPAESEPEKPIVTIEVPNVDAPVDVPTLVEGAQPIEEDDDIRIENIILPNGFSLHPDEESKVDVDEVLEKHYPEIVGPSVGGYSSHMTECFSQCKRKFWLSYVNAKKLRVQPRPLKFGSILHCCMALRYGGRHEETFRPCDLVAQAGAPDLAGEVRELIEQAISFHGQEEMMTWCPRAVEYNGIWWVKVPIGRKYVALPFSFKIDLILGLKQQHEPHPGPGLYPQGVYIVDHKTASRVTTDLIEGFGNDWQFKSYSKAFVAGGYEKRFGPLAGVMPSILIKGCKPGKDPVRRIIAPYPKALLDEFCHDELFPAMAGIHERMSDEKIFSTPLARMADGSAAWPRNTTHCVNRWGMCEYFAICDSGRFDHIEFKSARHFRIEDLESPSTEIKQKVLGRKANVVDSQKESVQSAVAKMFGQYILTLSTLEDNAYRYITVENFVGARGARKQSETAKVLGQYLKEMHVSMAEMKASATLDQLLPYCKDGIDVEVAGTEKISYTKTGLKWNLSGKRGTTSWKMVATWIVDKVWYNADNATPQ